MSTTAAAFSLIDADRRPRRCAAPARRDRSMSSPTRARIPCLSLTRRAVLAGVVAASATRLTYPAFAQQDAPPPASATPAFGARRRRQARARTRQRRLSTRRSAPLPDSIATLDFDAWRDIRFKSDKPLLGAANGNFRLELFHLGHLYRRPVVVNVLRDGIPAPIPYASNLFDYGHNKIPPTAAGQSRLRRLPPALSAQRAACDGRGDRVSRRELLPLSRPRPALRPFRARPRRSAPADEVDEEFPFFREFWIETPDPAAERIVHPRAARRRIGDRRLPLRDLAGAGDQRRRRA